MTREEFTQKIRELCECIDNDEVVADQVEVHQATVRRWKSGAACPLPRMREWVIHELTLLAEDV